jgi:hypothetical protein
MIGHSRLCIKLPKVESDPVNKLKRRTHTPVIRKNNRKSIDLKTRDLLASLKRVKIVSLTPEPQTSVINSCISNSMVQIFDRNSLDLFKKRFQKGANWKTSLFQLEIAKLQTSSKDFPGFFKAKRFLARKNGHLKKLVNEKYK